MNTDLEKIISLVAPRSGGLDEIFSVDNLPPFGKLQVDFASEVSRELLASPAARSHGDVVALAYWLRASNIRRLIKDFEAGVQSWVPVPKGLVFHIAPSNVDTIFVYSWFLSLLCGNRNIVRLSSKASPASNMLTQAINVCLEKPEFKEIAKRVRLVQFGYDDTVSSYLSSRCDVRVVWGGDQTIQHFRQFPLPAHATEVVFPDKVSLCVLAASTVAQLNPLSAKKIAGHFYNDAYWFGQMACSSPRMVLWLGDLQEIETAKQIFWAAVRAVVGEKGDLLEVAELVNKRVACDLIGLGKEVEIIDCDNRVTRIAFNTTTDLPLEQHCGGGLFFEFNIKCLSDLRSFLSRKFQTATYFGLSTAEIAEFIRNGQPQGVDRWIDVGKALDFQPIWDGQDLFRAFLRQVTV
jgi:hypothetical protein